MALSMTGYGRAQSTVNNREITVEIKSVNSRYFEYNSRLPRNLGYADDALKKALAASMARGKVDLFLSVRTLEGSVVEVEPNLPLAAGYYNAMRKMADSLDLTMDVSPAVLSRFSDLFSLKSEDSENEALLNDVLMIENEAIKRHTTMRAAEGQKLTEDISQKLQKLEGMLAQVEIGSEGRVQRYTQRLYERLREVLENTSIEEGRILTEAAVFADKTAVDEETMRLHSHIKQYREILQGADSIGRKLDFLTQELNREVNTIGSKCQELEITRLVVDMKAEIEKIREQVQNLE
ncbi:MAG: YicC/YloC family endoribonuclease [Oscillospiraceae bacterium]